MIDAKFEELKGKTLTKVDPSEYEIDFYCSDGSEYKLYHEQSCCESVRVEKVVGNFDDLIGEPLYAASETTNSENPPDVKMEDQESFTWTYYFLATNKGSVSIRWYGDSNGYYSESVDFARIEP